jgi:hypothetical protein
MRADFLATAMHVPMYCADGSAYCQNVVCKHSYLSADLCSATSFSLLLLNLFRSLDNLKAEVRSMRRWGTARLPL